MSPIREPAILFLSVALVGRSRRLFPLSAHIDEKRRKCIQHVQLSGTTCRRTREVYGGIDFCQEGLYTPLLFTRLAFYKELCMKTGAEEIEVVGGFIDAYGGG